MSAVCSTKCHTSGMRAGMEPFQNRSPVFGTNDFELELNTKNGTAVRVEMEPTLEAIGVVLDIGQQWKMDRLHAAYATDVKDLLFLARLEFSYVRVGVLHTIFSTKRSHAYFSPKISVSNSLLSDS